MTYDQLDKLDRRLHAMESEITSLRSIILQEKHKLQGPKRAGLYPGQIDNHVDPDDQDECST